MSMNGSYIVVCEGASEAHYLTLLNRLLEKLPPPLELRGRPIRFNLPMLDDASLDRSSAYAGKCVGNGKFNLLIKAWSKAAKDNKRCDIKIWADWDLYARNDGNCQSNLF